MNRNNIGRRYFRAAAILSRPLAVALAAGALALVVVATGTSVPGTDFAVLSLRDLVRRIAGCGGSFHRYQRSTPNCLLPVPTTSFDTLPLHGKNLRANFPS